MLSFPIKWPRGNPGTSGTERGARVSSEAWGWGAATADGLRTLIASAGQGPPGRTPARFTGRGELPAGKPGHSQVPGVTLRRGVRKVARAAAFERGRGGCGIITRVPFQG